MLVEAQPFFAAKLEGWRPRGPKAKPGNTYSTILNVFAPLLDQDVQHLTEEGFAKVADADERANAVNGKTMANGQASRAMS